MKAKMEQTRVTNANPILSVDKNGFILYSNKADNLLLKEWGVKVGEKLPSSIVDLVQRVISLNSPEKMEVNVGNKEYLVVFSLFPQQECVNISGFDMSEQTNLERKLRESEDDLAEVQKMAHIGNWKWNIVTGELFWSDEVYRIFGLDPQEFEATFDEYFNYVHPEDRDFLNNSIKKAFEGEPYSVDCRIITPNGEERVVHTDADIIFNEDNIPVYARGIVQDITERKLAEDTLHASEERLISVLENSLDCAYRLDLQNNYFDYMSPVIEQIIGFSPEEMNIIGRNGLLDHIHPDDRSIVIAEIAKTLDEGFGTHKYRFKCKNGKYRWLADHFSFIKDKSGLIRFRAGVIRNITEQKRAEDALRESMEKYRIVADNTYDWEFWLGPDDRFLYMSPSCERVTGYAVWEFMDNPYLLDELVHSEDRQTFLQHRHDNTSGLNGDIEFRIVTKDGEIRWIHHLCQPIYDGEGRYVGKRGSNRNVTERKRAEEALKKANDSLEVKVKERTEELEEAYNWLKKSEKSLAEAQRIAHTGNWDWDLVTGEVCCSDELYHIFL